MIWWNRHSAVELADVVEMNCEVLATGKLHQGTFINKPNFSPTDVYIVVIAHPGNIFDSFTCSTFVQMSCGAPEVLKAEERGRLTNALVLSFAIAQRL